MVLSAKLSRLKKSILFPFLYFILSFWKWDAWLCISEVWTWRGEHPQRSRRNQEHDTSKSILLETSYGDMECQEKMRFGKPPDNNDQPEKNIPIGTEYSHNQEQQDKLLLGPHTFSMEQQEHIQIRPSTSSSREQERALLETCFSGRQQEKILLKEKEKIHVR